MKKQLQHRRCIKLVSGALIAIGLAAHTGAKAQVINTIAGNVQGGFAGDGGPAGGSQLNSPYGVAVDTAGNVYIADQQNHRIRKITKSTGNTSTIAGNGTGGFGGDGGPATSAKLNLPTGVAVDKAGNVYIADQGNNRIRKVSVSTGNISTLAGATASGYTGDGGPATAATLNTPYAICLDTAGNIYIGDVGNSAIRRITKSTGNISTVAGNGTYGYSGDGGAATFAKLGSPRSVFVDAPGNIFISDANNDVIRKVTASSGIISTIAGTGATGYTGDGGPATAAKLCSPVGISADASGNVFFTENCSNAIRKITASTGKISTICGNGTLGFAGDFGQATAALLNVPAGICTDAAGNIFIGDNGNNRVRMITASSGVITTFAGATQGGYSGDGTSASLSELNDPQAVAIDTAGNIYIAEWKNNCIRKITKSTGFISTVAGNGTGGFSGDGGPATLAQLYSPTGVAVDKAGNIYISDDNNYRIRKVTKATGIISTIAGTGSGGMGGDGGPAVSAQVKDPYGMCLDTAGNLYFADNGNHAVRKISKATGNITTVAGNGTSGYSGNGGAATLATLNQPTSVFVDGSNNVFIADAGNHVIRKINGSTGLISTFAGTGLSGISGDSLPATSAKMNRPTGVCADAAGNVYISDANASVIRIVRATDGTIYTLSGKRNISGYAGDGGIPANALFNNPYMICLDKPGQLYIVDELNNRLRRMDVLVPTVGIHEIHAQHLLLNV
ncbi:MAG: NHL domain-containing protein, partial [Bacteroidia bacterium]